MKSVLVTSVCLFLSISCRSTASDSSKSQLHDIESGDYYLVANNKLVMVESSLDQKLQYALSDDSIKVCFGTMTNLSDQSFAGKTYKKALFLREECKNEGLNTNYIKIAKDQVIVLDDIGKVKEYFGGDSFPTIGTTIQLYDKTQSTAIGEFVIKFLGIGAPDGSNQGVHTYSNQLTYLCTGSYADVCDLKISRAKLDVVLK